MTRASAAARPRRSRSPTRGTGSPGRFHPRRRSVTSTIASTTTPKSVKTSPIRLAIRSGRVEKPVSTLSACVARRAEAVRRAPLRARLVRDRDRGEPRRSPRQEDVDRDVRRVEVGERVAELRAEGAERADLARDVARRSPSAARASSWPCREVAQEPVTAARPRCRRRRRSPRRASRAASGSPRAGSGGRRRASRRRRHRAARIPASSALCWPVVPHQVEPADARLVAASSSITLPARVRAAVVDEHDLVVRGRRREAPRRCGSRACQGRRRLLKTGTTAEML